MPKYIYRCVSCDDCFDIVHGMTETQTICELCGISDKLVRVPQILNIKTNRPLDPVEQIGSHVKEAIKDNAEILKQQKKEAILRDWEKDV